MKLMTKTLIKALEKYSYESQIGIKDPIALARFFSPIGSFDWYILGYDPKSRMAYCYAEHNYLFGEFGPVSIDELELVRLPLGLSIEREIRFKKCKLSECSGYKPS